MDSKKCQYKQIKDHEKRSEELKDFDKIWHEVLSRDFNHKTAIHKMKQDARASEGKAVQDFLKQQMVDKIERERIHEEINEQTRLIEKEAQEVAQSKIDKSRSDYKKREMLKDDMLKQIYENRELRKQQLERELKIDQIFNEQIQIELEKDVETKKAEHAHFKREIHHYLDHLRISRHQNDIDEREKEKLIEDVRKKQCDDEWMNRCKSHTQRVAVNQRARAGQLHQIHRQEKLKEQEAIFEKQFHCAFNEREMKERKLLQEEKWQQRLKSHRYGEELIEQQKLEELKRKAEKQKLEEELMLIEKERQRCEEIGKDFVKSSQDVLPPHPNLLVIMRGMKY